MQDPAAGQRLSQLFTIYARGALSFASEPKQLVTVVKYHGFNNISILQRGGPSMLARGLLG